jgi:type III secretory pathway component EscT
MMPRASAWLAWLLAALTVAMFLASAALYVLTRSAQSLAIGSLAGPLASC